MDTAADRDLVGQTVLDYFEGWYAGDPARMDRALHDDLVKRRAGDEGHEALGRERTKTYLPVPPRPMAAGGGAPSPSRGSGPRYAATGSVVVGSREYQHLHRLRTPGGWKIVTAFWQVS